MFMLLSSSGNVVNRTTETINTIQHDIVQILSVYFVNATSLAKPNALQKLGSEMSSLSIDIALIAETWLNSKHSDSNVSVVNYNLFRHDQIGRCGGGVFAAGVVVECLLMSEPVLIHIFIVTY